MMKCDYCYDRLPSKPIAPGYPVDTFRRENAALRHVLEKLRGTIAELSGLEEYTELS
jgi:hypothetical protein